MLRRSPRHPKRKRPPRRPPSPRTSMRSPSLPQPNSQRDQRATEPKLHHHPRCPRHYPGQVRARYRLRPTSSARGPRPRFRRPLRLCNRCQRPPRSDRQCLSPPSNARLMDDLPRRRLTSDPARQQAALHRARTWANATSHRGSSSPRRSPRNSNAKRRRRRPVRLPRPRPEPDCNRGRPRPRSPPAASTSGSITFADFAAKGEKRRRELRSPRSARRTLMPTPGFRPTLASGRH